MRNAIRRTQLSSLAVILLMAVCACSTQKNTSKSRWWHSFTARYNTYYNGSQAFIDGCQEKESGNRDNYTELIPLYTVGNKESRQIGSSNFDRAIEKSEKTIKQHSIKRRPEWNKSRRKTAKDIEWLGRREYNPFLWHAWLLLGKSQFQKGEFDEAAATFSYMSRLYRTQPAINGLARAWLAKCYTELDWLYDAEDVITKMRRDSMHYRAVKDWDYTYANYYIRRGHYEEALPYLRKVIKHERRSKQRAREWFLMGQLQSLLGHRELAYKAFQHVVRQNPPYELEFNARIAQTEVMAKGNAKKMIGRLRRMAASDNNQEYLDQVYYAIGNIYLAQRDTLHAISAYEDGNRKSTRNGIEKGVLLLQLGNLYWEREKYNDAQRCYGEAIGLLDQDRKDYEQLARRSKVLDELVPYTDAVYLQDSLQVLARLPEAERNKAIDRVIDELIKKEKEEQRRLQEAEAEQMAQEQGAVGSRQQAGTTPQTTAGGQQGLWYFYNPQAVSQGKQTFQRQWGKRENADNWQRINQTVVRTTPTDSEDAEDNDETDTDDKQEQAADQEATGEQAEGEALDPHKREYYLAQIPFTDEQLAVSNDIIKDGLFNAGVIFKDKLDNLRLSEKNLTRLINQYPDYERNDETLYHLFLLYSRLGRHTEADHCLDMMQANHAESQWTILLSDPYFAENQKFGVHIEDSLYAATYDAFKANRYGEVHSNARLSAERFPLGENRPKFLFIEGLSMLNDGNAEGCVERMKQIVEQYPQSEVTEMAGMIVRGVQSGRTLYGGKFDLGDVWSRRGTALALQDSTQVDTLTLARNTSYVFLLAYKPDSVNQNQLLFELARHNFTNYLVRNFDIQIDSDQGINRMMVSGFLSYDEALQYARQLYAVPQMAERLKGLRRIIISADNLRLLGTRYSYKEYDEFFEEQIAPIKISNEQLLILPEHISQEEEPEPIADDTEEPATGDDSVPATTPDDDLDAIIGDLPANIPPAVPTEDVFDTPNEPTEFTEPAAPAEPAEEAPTAIPQLDPNYIEFDDDFYR